MTKCILIILIVFVLIVGCTTKNNTETTLPEKETTECSATEGTVIPDGTSAPEENTTSPETTEATTVPETTETPSEATTEEPGVTETKPNGDVGNMGEDD